MKKTLLALLLILCMLVTLTAFTVSAEETEAVAETSEAAHTDHCVCGGNAVNVGDHTTCETIVYTPISEALTKAGMTTQTVNFGNLPSGNYYLDVSIHVTADSAGSTGKTVNICLNGNNITTASGERTLNCIKFSDYSFCDCQGEMVDGRWVGGTVSSGTSTYGAITYTRAGSTLNIYGGKWTSGGHSENPRYGGLIVIAMDGGKDLNSSGAYDSADYKTTNLAYMNLYNGELSGGTASRGGNLYLMHAGIMNMYGGRIVDGTTVYSLNGSTAYPARGGNLYGDRYSTLNMYGGDICDGVAAKYSVDNTADNAQGGNIYSQGKVNIYGGNIYNGLAEHNPYTNTAHTGWNTSTPGRGGNIYMSGYAATTLNIYGGNIYNGKANGIGGGNIWFQTGTFNMSGGKIWGGEANADHDEKATAYLRNAYDVCGGSVRIETGTFNMTGGSIGIDADGNPAGGTNYPSGSEAGNLYVQGTANLSGGTIAYGHSLGKGGNLGGSGTITVSGTMVIRDGKADTYGGNWTIYDNGNCTISGGTISGGYAGTYGGNIIVDGSSSNTDADALTITGGTITGGKSGSHGGNIAVNNASKVVNISGTAVISNGEATVSGKYGGNFYIKGTVNLSGSAKVTGGKSSSYGGSIYSTADGKLNVSGAAQVTGGASTGSTTPSGGNIASRGTVTVTDTAVVSGGKALSGNGGNIYLWNTSTLTVSGNAQILDGESKNAGGNIYANGTVTLEGNSIVSGGKVNNSSSGNIYVNANGTLTIKDNVQIKDGTCAKEGGNIANYGVLNISGNATVSGGTAGTYGGNIYNGSGKTLTITGGTIENGTAATVGGNISNYGEMTLQDATVSGGTAQAGGNIYFAANSTNTISNVTVSDGKAILGADGEYGIKKDADTNAETLYAVGGNLYVEKGLALTLDNCTLSGGWAIYRGGSIYNRGTLTINGGSITGGLAKTESTEQKISTGGGNIYTETTMTIDGTTVSGGQATHGGNLSMSGGTQTIKNATISDGNANLMCDGTTNGNGGNVYSQSGATTTITGSTITGGVGRRGGSVGAWGKVTIEDTTISDGKAVYNGGNIMTYGNGQLTLNTGTVITGGEAENGGGSVHFGSNAGKKQTINEGVTVGMGSASAGGCINLNGGDLYLVGAPSIAQIRVVTTSDTQEMIVDELTVTAPISVVVPEAGAFATSATDKLACFENTQGYVKAYRDGKLYMDAPVAVFVSDNGSDSNPGTQTAPYLTMDHAMHMVADNGTVTIVDKLTQPAWSKHKKSIVLTGGELDLTTGASLTLGDSVQFKAMTVTMPTTAYAIYCNGFKTVINEDVTVRYYDGTDYTTQCAKSSIYGGTNEGTVTGTDLTVLAGTWGFVYGGNEKVKLTGDVHLTVGGKINDGLDYVTLGHTSDTAGQYLILGGSKGADINGTVYMNVNEGTTGSSIHGGSNGAVHVDNIELTVSGGEGMAIYGAGRGGAQTVGTVNFYYEGGTYEQIFGGVLSNCLTGDVNLYVTGGNITRRLYGGCYSGYETLKGWTADNYVTGNVKLIIGEGANISCDADYSDRGIYGHSRRGTMSNTDEEKATIIFLSKAAYENNSSKLGSVDFVTTLFMGSLPVADLICYLDWSADDTSDVIYANATAVKDPQNSNTGDASAISATAALTLSDTSFFYTGNAIEPATVTVSDNWLYGDVVLAYTDNTEIGTGKATITGNGLSVSAEFAITQKPDVAQVVVGDTTTTYTWLQEAVDAAPAGGYMKLLGGTEESITVSSDLYLDLNGYSITGTVTVNEGVTLYGMDATTDDYDCSDGYGTIKAAGAGTVAAHYKTSVTGAVRRYLTYTESDGSLSFHRIYLGVTSMSLRPSVKGVGYKATFRADSKAQELLGEAEAFGYKLWLFDDEGNEMSATRYLAKEKFTNSGTVTLRLQNFDIVNYGEKEIYAEVYLKLADGTVIDSADYSYTLKAMIERIDKDTGVYTDAQMESLQKMLGDYADALTAAQWAIANIMSWIAQ